MPSFGTYLAIAVVASVIITLAVIGGYEVFRNLQLDAKERRRKRATQAAKQPSRQTDMTTRPLQLLDTMQWHAPGSTDEFAALLGWAKSTVAWNIRRLVARRLAENHSVRLVRSQYVSLYAPVLHGAPAPKPAKSVKTRKPRPEPVVEIVDLTVRDPWGRPVAHNTQGENQ